MTAHSEGTNDGERSSIDWQVARASEEHGADFDSTLLAVTLALYRAQSVYDRAEVYEMSPHGLTVAQFNILTVLHRADRPLTMSELSHAVSVRPANLTSVVDQMARRRLIKRQVNPTDRRSVLISKTASAERFLAKFLPGHWEHLAGLMHDLTRDERALLADLLERLRISVETASEVRLNGVS